MGGLINCHWSSGLSLEICVLAFYLKPVQVKRYYGYYYCHVPLISYYFINVSTAPYLEAHCLNYHIANHQPVNRLNNVSSLQK